MKQLFSFLVIGLLGSTLLSQGLPAKFAKIEFKETLVNFGEVQEGEIAETTFIFSNRGVIPLQIFDVAPNCSCTQAEAEATTIAPGKTGVIRATVNTKGRPGNLEKLVAIVSNDPQNPQVTLTLRATVKNFHKLAESKFQAKNIFEEGCRSCHADRAKGKTGESLYRAVCQVCHQQGKSASPLDAAWMRRQPSDRWQTVIISGTPKMPGFASTQKGPLDESQLKSLTQYLKGLATSPAASKTNPKS